MEIQKQKQENQVKIQIRQTSSEELKDQLGNEEMLVYNIIKQKAYFPSESFNSVFQKELNQLIINSEHLDNTRVGQIIGSAVLGVVGFAIQFTIFGIIAGIIVGGILGGYAGKQIKKKIKRNNNLKHFDLFIINLSCFLQAVDNQILKSKSKKIININSLRFYIQKSLREFIMIQYFDEFSDSNKREFKIQIDRFAKILKSHFGLKTMKILYKICKIFLKLLTKQPIMYQVDCVLVCNLINNCLKTALLIYKMQTQLNEECQNLITKIENFITSESLINFLQQYQEQNVEFNPKEFISKLDKEVTIDDIRQMFKGQELDEIIMQKIKSNQQSVGEDHRDQNNDNLRLIDFIKDELKNIENNLDKNEEKKQDNNNSSISNQFVESQEYDNNENQGDIEELQEIKLGQIQILQENSNQQNDSILAIKQFQQSSIIQPQSKSEVSNSNYPRNSSQGVNYDSRSHIQMQFNFQIENFDLINQKQQQKQQQPLQQQLADKQIQNIQYLSNNSIQNQKQSQNIHQKASLVMVAQKQLNSIQGDKSEFGSFDQLDYEQHSNKDLKQLKNLDIIKSQSQQSPRKSNFQVSKNKISNLEYENTNQLPIYDASDNIQQFLQQKPSKSQSQKPVIQQSDNANNSNIAYQDDKSSSDVSPQIKKYKFQAKNILFKSMSQNSLDQEEEKKHQNIEIERSKDDNDHPRRYSIKPLKSDSSISESNEINFMNKLRNYIQEDTQKWETIFNKDGIKIYQQYEPGNPVVILRTEVVIENCNKQDVFDQIYQEKLRPKWDKVVQGFQILERYSQHSDLIYFYIDPGYFITKRDFIEKRVWKNDFPTKNDISIVFFSTEHPLYPPKKGFIRAHSIISGYVLRSEGDHTKLFIIACTDIKGSIPKYVVNSVASNAPSKWVRSLNLWIKEYKKNKSQYENQQKKPIKQ